MKKFISFLKEKSIKSPEEVTMPILKAYQDYLSATGIKPQSVNNELKAVKRVYSYMEQEGYIINNPCRLLQRLKVSDDDKKGRGCYEPEKVAGVFNCTSQSKTWEEELYIPALLIYTTGMRNCEIKRLQLSDIQEIEGCRFIDIKKSKTSNGVRQIPLHDFVYEKIVSYANGKDEPFKKLNAKITKRANDELGKRLGLTCEELDEKNITFYSGRHFWKTLMSKEGLGEDVEELFMGHKVSADVKKLYNHLDKRGQKHLAEKAKEIFAILDRCVFKKETPKERIITAAKSNLVISVLNVPAFNTQRIMPMSFNVPAQYSGIGVEAGLPVQKLIGVNR
jgi:integrase